MHTTQVQYSEALRQGVNIVSLPLASIAIRVRVVYSAHLSNGKVHAHNVSEAVCSSPPSSSLSSCSTNAPQNLLRFVTITPKEHMYISIAKHYKL